MTWRMMSTAVLGTALVAGTAVDAVAQTGLAPDGGEPPMTARYFDPRNGVSLAEAVARALRQEPGLLADRSAVDAAAGRRTQAGLRPNPSVSFERREEVGGMDNQTSLMAEWPLDLFRRAGRVAVAERELEAARYEVADRERLLAADVRERYGEVLAAVRDLGVADELVVAIRRQHAIVRARVEEGASPRLERDLLDVELRRLEAELLLRAARADAAIFGLKRVLGLEADAPLTVRETLEAVVREDRAFGSKTAAGPPAAAEPAAEIVQRRPDVLAAAAAVRAADARVDRARREGRVDVSVFAGYMRMEGGFPQLAFGADGRLEPVHGVFHNVAAGAMVMVPLLNRNQGEAAAARAEHAAAEARLRASELAAQAELAAARARHEYARRAVAVYTDDARRLARENLEVVRQTYDLGRATVFDVLAEERRYLDTEQALTEALTEAFEARTALERALGGVR